MPALYSGDLRERVAEAVGSGASARAAAGRFGVSISTAIRWAQRLRAEGHVKARRMGGDRRSRLLEHREVVLGLLAKEPDLTLQEICDRLAARHGLTVGVTTLWRYLAGHKITLKKRVCTPPSKTAPT